MTMLVREGETLFFDKPKDARRFLKCSQFEYECALDLGKVERLVRRRNDSSDKKGEEK